MKALITGIAGFIGHHAAVRLAADGFDVIGVDSLTPYYSVDLKRARLAAMGERARFVEMDVAEHEAFAALVREEKPDVVIHLAAQAGVRYSLENPFAYARSNLLGHLSVLEACRRAEGLSHLIYASSSSVYGGSAQLPFRESDRVDGPVSLYAATKGSDELMSASYAHLYGLPQAGLRFFTVYGEFGRPDMAYWLFTERILRGEPIKVFNQGDMSRDQTYVGDVVDTLSAMAMRPPRFASGDRPHRVYNIGANTPTPLMRMIAVLEDAIGRKADTVFEPMQPGDVKETYADVDRLIAEYGFSPKTPVEIGLPRFVSWYRRHHGV